MNVLVVVSTCPRPGVDYLPGTLARLDETGAQGLQKMVLSDGPIVGDCSWPYLERIPARRSTRENMWAAYRLAVDAPVDLLIYCEDDIFPCAGGVERMADVGVPEGVAFVSYHDKKWRTVDRAAPGLHLVQAPDADGRGFWGSQALVFPRRMFEYLVTRDPYSIRAQNPRRNCDRVLEDFTAVSPWPRIAFHSPSLVRHVGEVSIAHPDRDKVQTHVPWNYPGDAFDARTLAAPPEVFHHGAA